MASLIGKEIGKYRITERLGQGGMAEVYAGIHTHLDRKVAVKVLHSYLLEGGDFVARFKREAKAVANLRHPNIVQVYDFDIQDDLIFMVMEYVDGVNLHTKLVEVGNRGERMPIKLIGSIINDIASALDYAHSKEMLHRDIKPSNIMIDQNDKAYLTDFGIAKLLSDQKFTATGTLVGTPAYMSPEQGRGDDLTEESDIYSLGIIAFEMLTGQVPYDAKTPIGIVHKQINDPVPNMSELVDGVPGSAQEVIDRALAKSPEGRFSSAEALVGALRVALTALESTDPIAVPKEESPTVVDDGLEAPTVTMKAEEMEQATVVMETETKKEEPPPVEPTKEKPKEKTDQKSKGEKKKIPLWAYIAGAVAILAVVGVILTQVFDFGSGTSSSTTAEEVKATVSTGSTAGDETTTSSSSSDDDTTTGPVETGPIELIFAAEHQNEGLNLVPYGDHDYEIIDTEDSIVWRSGNGQILPADDNNDIADSYLMFQIADDLIFELPPGEEVYILVEYLDEGRDKFFIQYDSHFGGPSNNEQFRESAYITKTGSGEFIVAELILEDAFFGNRQHGMYDFRIVDMGDGAETINSLIITLLPTEAGSPGEMSAEEFFHQGVAYFEQELYPEAVESFDLALEAGYSTAEVYNYRGRSNRGRELYEEAIEDFTMAIEMEPETFWNWLNRGRSKMALEYFHGALEDLIVATEYGPDEWITWHYLGEAYYYTGEDQYFGEAHQSYDRAIELEPSNPLSHLMRAQLKWFRNGDAVAALEDLHIAVEYAVPGDSGPYTMRGLIYLETGQFELCFPDLSTAIEIAPEDPWPILLRGDCFIGLGDIDPARVDYERFIELAGNNPDFNDQVNRVQAWLNEN